MLDVLDVLDVPGTVVTGALVSARPEVAPEQAPRRTTNAAKPIRGAGRVPTGGETSGPPRSHHVVVLAAASSALYDSLVALHVTCALAGFGAVAVSGVYGGMARHPDSSEEVKRYFAGQNLLEWLLVPVPFLGAAALVAGGREANFTEVWVIGGGAVWVVACALLLGVVRPAEARLRSGSGTARAGRALLVASVASDILFVVALALMVAQPQ